MSVFFNVDAERSVLGAILSAGSYDVAAGQRVLDAAYATGLEPVDFYYPSNGELFAALVRIRVAGMPLDPVSVADELQRAGAGPDVLGRLHRLAYEVVAFSPAAHWARIVQREARRRRLDDQRSLETAGRG